MCVLIFPRKICPLARNCVLFLTFFIDFYLEILKCFWLIAKGSTWRKKSRYTEVPINSKIRKIFNPTHLTHEKHWGKVITAIELYTCKSFFHQKQISACKRFGLIDRVWDVVVRKSCAKIFIFPTYVLTSWSRSLIERLARAFDVNAFYTRRYLRSATLASSQKMLASSRDSSEWPVEWFRV